MSRRAQSAFLLFVFILYCFLFDLYLAVNLDEIADMKPATQVQLLKVIENKTFKRIGGAKDILADVRIIAATNKKLVEEVRKGNFREDLFYRLNVIPIYLPPLRERRSDIPVLAGHFIDIFNREFKKDVKGLAKEAEEAFIAYPWPGNVRELRNIIERAMILENEQYILPDHLPLELSSVATTDDTLHCAPLKFPEGGLDIENVERELIRQALDRAGRNQTKAAKLLNLTRDALRYRMQKFGFFEEKAEKGKTVRERI
jgi:two-component system, NtrC family, response regulator AtoC